MTTLHLHNQCPATVGVPHIFIEKYMADANGEFIKVYLYLLRCMNTPGETLSISAIADFLNHTEKDIMRALTYWEKNGVITLEKDESNQLIGLCLNNLASANTTAPIKASASSSHATNEAAAPVATTQAATTPVVTASAASAASASAKTPTKRTYTLDEVKAFCNNHEVSELLFIVETYLKHPLNSTEMNTLFFWYDELHFSGEMIEYLVEYCITNGHSSLRYMDKVAQGWSENGIDTIDKAKDHVSIRSKAYYSIMKAFGISGRNLADSEMAFVNKWTKEYGFDTELIQEACKRTISATQKPSFEYADSILTRWHNQKVTSIKDVATLDADYSKTKRSSNGTSTQQTSKKNKFNNFHQRDYDATELEKLLLTTSVNK